MRTRGGVAVPNGLVLAAMIGSVASGLGPRHVAAQEPLPMLGHGGRHFWLDIRQAVAIERARKAMQDAGLPLDPSDETGAKWAVVGRKPGLYVGVGVYADGPTNSIVSDEATRVLVGITVAFLPSCATEAGVIREAVDRYICTGSAAAPAAGPSPAQPVPPQGIHYEGNWEVHEGTFRATAEVGAWVEYVFQGTGVRWLGQRFDDAGLAEVRIDGQVVAEVDQYGPGRKLPFDWKSGVLPAGTHRIRVTSVGRKREQSTGTYTNVAGFEALGADP